MRFDFKKLFNIVKRCFCRTLTLYYLNILGQKRQKKSLKMIGGQIHLEIYRWFDYKI